MHPVRLLAGHGVAIALGFSSDGELLAAVDGQRTLRVWRVKDGSLMRTTDVPDGTVETVSFSPDDRHLVTTGGKTARIWNVDSGKLEHVLAGHTSALTSAAFSPDGRLVVTTSFDHDARIWDARTGKPRSLLRDKVDYAVVNDGAFSADGRWVVTAGPQGAAIWSAQTGRFLFFVRSPRELLLSTARFSHHGWRIATGGATNGSIEAYDCRLCGTLDDLVAMAEDRLAKIGRKG
jgi:WD40 repeat protein